MTSNTAPSPHAPDGDDVVGPRWLDVDAEALARAADGTRALRLGHHAEQFRPFRPDALAELSRLVPTAWVVSNEGRLPLLTPPAGNLNLAAEECLETMTERCVSLRLYHVQHLPQLAPLVRDVLDQVEEIVWGRPGGMVSRDASIFCGSPGSVVPVHCDRHHNVLLQLAGVKEVGVGWFSDPSRQAAEIERNFGRHLNMEVAPDRSEVHTLGPGEGIYLPPYTIHWVRCGPEPSTALSASFATSTSVQAERVHACNARLRRLHLTPVGPGVSPTRDRAKAAAIGLGRRLRHRAAT